MSRYCVVGFLSRQVTRPNLFASDAADPGETASYQTGKLEPSVRGATIYRIAQHLAHRSRATKLKCVSGLILVRGALTSKRADFPHPVTFKFVDETSKIASVYRCPSSKQPRPSRARSDSAATAVTKEINAQILPQSPCSASSRTPDIGTSSLVRPPDDAEARTVTTEVRRKSTSPGHSLWPPRLPLQSESTQQQSTPGSSQDAPASVFSPMSPFSLVGLRHSGPSDFTLHEPLNVGTGSSMQSPPSVPLSEQIYNLLNPTMDSPEQPTLDLRTLLDQVVSQQGEIQRGYDEALLTLPIINDDLEGTSVPALGREPRVTRRIPRGDRMMMRLMRHYVEVEGLWVSITRSAFVQQQTDRQDGD
jgi:hypothetical protein